MKHVPRGQRASLACANLAGHREAGPSTGVDIRDVGGPIGSPVRARRAPLAALGWGGVLVKVQGGPVL